MMHSWLSSFGTAQKYSSHLFLHIWVESFQTIWHMSCLICVSPFSNVLCLMSNVLWTSNFKFHFHVTLYITSDTAHFEKLSLRGCKFSLERSKEKLDFHFTVGWAFWKVTTFWKGTTDYFLKNDHWPLFEKWPLTTFWKVATDHFLKSDHWPVWNDIVGARKSSLLVWPVGPKTGSKEYISNLHSILVIQKIIAERLWNTWK